MSAHLGRVVFGSNADLITFAKDFFRDRLNSLDYDVKRCLRKEIHNNKPAYSPVPGLMYCVSIIDLLGGILAGNTEGAHTTNAKSYVINFMKPIYGQKFSLLWEGFYRHQTVHLSFPEVAIRYQGKVISWNLDDDDIQHHLTLQWGIDSIPIFNIGNIPIEGKFVVNIGILKDDIIDSVNNPSSGYLTKLTADSFVQGHFDDAMNQIYEVTNFP